MGGKKFTLFSNEEFCPFSDGDRIAFDYEVKKLRTGSRMPYNLIVPDSLRLTVPSNTQSTWSSQTAGRKDISKRIEAGQ